MPGSKHSDNRTRNWNFVGYPESLPENWRDIIDETHIEWVCSPLHDQDIDPTGEKKKDHYHVTLLFPTLKSYDQVQELVCGQLGQPIPIPCQSVKGSIRYMVHKDNPDKHQYNWSDIVPHGGADLSSLCQPTLTERMVLLKEILKFCTDNNVCEFADLNNIAIENGWDEWLAVINNFNTYAVTAHVKSLRYKEQKTLERAARKI